MVHIPVLKIDVPDPDISSLLPAAASAAIGALTSLHDAVRTFLHPLPAEAAAAYEEAEIAALPRELRKARKRIAARRIEDVDKQSSELEEAAFAFYRRMLRTNAAGLSDEDLEDAAWRRMLAPAQLGEGADANAVLAATAAAGAASAEYAAAPPQLLVAAAEAVASACAADEGPSGAAIVLPGHPQRVAVASAAGGMGLALGVGLVRLAAMAAHLRRRGRRRAGIAGSSTSGAARRVVGGKGGSQRRPSGATSSGNTAPRRGNSGEGGVGGARRPATRGTQVERV
jgi:hypothetical protein